MGAIPIIMNLISMLPAAIQATTQIVNIVAKVKDIVTTGKEPSGSEWDALNEELASLTKELNTDPA